MIFSFFTFEFSFQLSAGGSLESADVVGEEGALGVGENLTTAAVARGTNTGADGHSGIALVGDPLGVAGAAATATATAAAARDNPVEAGGLQGPEFLVGPVVRPCLVLRLSKREGIINYTLSSWNPSLIVSHPNFLFSRWGCIFCVVVTVEIELSVPAWFRRYSLWGHYWSGSFWNTSRKPRCAHCHAKGIFGGGDERGSLA